MTFWDFVYRCPWSSFFLFVTALVVVTGVVDAVISRGGRGG